MGEVTYIAERSKRIRFEAPVRVQECSIHCPCAIILHILHHIIYATSNAGALR